MILVFPTCLPTTKNRIQLVDLQRSAQSFWFHGSVSYRTVKARSCIACRYPRSRLREKAVKARS
ncbi:hypothetical protein HanXRQr2_Chr03g0126221 [Helianthus annuus]|uniref:Uncharacterized protein n=1 Tax=Helianthus annuus TaxID=4232 RepID=A0A9K3JIM8_HELAN|nr:hypothetical protein HanXRQr2_Chr03g0126221 [Helianthus annuus]